MKEAAREDAIAAGIAGLVERFRLGPDARPRLRCLLDQLAADPHAPTAVRDPTRVLQDHLADSLVALELDEVRRASAVADLGAGAGLPGLPLAIALPQARIALVESASRKCAFLTSLVGRCALQNVEVVHARAEAWPSGLRRFDLVTARALASLPVVLEYAAPLTAVGGSVVAWHGRREQAEDAAAGRAAQALGLELHGISEARPYAQVRHRYLYVWSKVMETPDRFPRRPGSALKRPLGS